jgi:hypothetical protein
MNRSDRCPVVLAQDADCRVVVCEVVVDSTIHRLSTQHTQRAANHIQVSPGQCGSPLVLDDKVKAISVNDEIVRYSAAIMKSDCPAARPGTCIHRPNDGGNRVIGVLQLYEPLQLRARVSAYVELQTKSHVD